MDGLSLVCHLGAHLDETAQRLADAVAWRSGMPIRWDSSVGSAQRRRLIEEGRPDITWMCGYLTHRLIDSGVDLEVVAAPIFARQSRAVYHSVIVSGVNTGYRTLTDLHGARLVINESESWSGHHAVMRHLASEGLPPRFFDTIIESGSHAASLEALTRDYADCAGIDCTVWWALTPHERRRYHVVDRTQDWPAPPFSVSGRLSPELRRRVADALVGLERIDERLAGVVHATAQGYHEMSSLPALP